jgi:hypothetical protein
MPSQEILINLEVIDEPMRKLISFFKPLTLASFGMILGSEVILLFVSTLLSSPSSSQAFD